MRSSWGLLPKIVSGEKTIESRWYQNQYQPWKKIDSGDIIYFKDSGQPVTVKAKAGKILRFDHLTPQKVKEILLKFGKDDGLDIQQDFNFYYKKFKNKNYCLLIFLKDVQTILPFKISKQGFGAMSAWLVVDDINQMKIIK